MAVIITLLDFITVSTNVSASPYAVPIAVTVGAIQPLHLEHSWGEISSLTEHNIHDNDVGIQQLSSSYITNPSRVHAWSVLYSRWLSTKAPFIAAKVKNVAEQLFMTQKLNCIDSKGRGVIMHKSQSGKS